MGIKLYSTFLAAGLTAPTMRLHAVIGGANSKLTWLSRMPQLLSEQALRRLTNSAPIPSSSALSKR
jgi:hypothetical protein